MLSYMKKRLKNLSKLQGKKRYIVLTWLAVELLSLPAAAHIVHNTAFEVDPVVTAVEIPTSEVGVSRYLVISNAGFGVKANGVTGDVEVNVRVNSTMKHGTRIGDAAQLPGPQTNCAQASETNAEIYLADRKTAASAGSATERAVMFEFRYDTNARPDFDFVAGVDSSATLSSCSS